MSKVFEVIQQRRSIRRYEPKPIPKDILLKLLEAARLAPSAGNRQPWRFVIVTDPERKKKLAEACHHQMFIADAGVVIVALSDPKTSPRWHALDTMIALEHIVLVATDLGLGTCWIGAFEPERVKEIIGSPKDLNPVAVLPVGYPAEAPPPRPRKRLEEIFFQEKYGNPLAL
ncbi:MAG: nitroreductase [Thermoprotei archaeon]|nr:MAG: nitroreductase [Thermoprotei archaeon]RLE82996.1 MAG: nitroreductase [Thermoprotei archaeon]RLF02659.1 MAG: nitroreductase [Thermoprotei archaeon]